jgi:hypothetical protein
MRPASVEPARLRPPDTVAVFPRLDEETWPSTDDAEGLAFGPLAWWGWLAAALLIVPLSCGQVTKSGWAGARLIRHASIFQALTVVSLTVAVVITTFGALLVLAVGFPVLLGAGLLLATVAAVALPSEARAADTEDRAAPAAQTPEERNKNRVRHHSRKAGVDGGGWLWDAQTVTV